MLKEEVVQVKETVLCTCRAPVTGATGGVTLSLLCTRHNSESGDVKALFLSSSVWDGTILGERFPERTVVR